MPLLPTLPTRAIFPMLISDDEGEIVDEVDEFVIKRNEIVQTFIQGIRGLCVEQGRDFKTAMNEITIDLLPRAMRTRAYKPNAWNMSLRVAEKEMPAELRKGKPSSLDCAR